METKQNEMGAGLIICFSFLMLNLAVNATDIGSSNDTDSEDRQPRVSGRIVKLYSGTRPEPIYCPREGFQPDPADCSVFYRCVKGAHNKFTVFRFQCGPGTIYDPNTEVCNFPQSTKRSECGGVASPSTDHNNENEIEASDLELPTPINTRPVYSEPKKQNTIHNSSPWATSNLENSHSSPSTPPSLSQESSTKQSISPSKQKGDACTNNGFMGDSQNCRKFYRCVGNQRGGFIRYEFSCSETTVWDDEVQSCNHPWAVKRSRCGRSNFEGYTKPSRTNEQLSNRQTSPGTTIQEQLQINYGDKVSQTQTQISQGQGQIKQNQTQINYGDRNKDKQNSQITQNQTQVSHGTAVSQTQTQINYGNGVQTQLQIDHTKESSQAQAQIYETTIKSSSTVLHGDDDESYAMQPSTQKNDDTENNGNECSESGFIGDEKDCKKFYRCVDDGKGGYIKYEFSCGEGTVWDSSIEACNHEWAVKECGGKVPVQSSQGAPQTTTTTKPTQNYQTTSDLMTIGDSEDPGYGNQNQQSETVTTTTTFQPSSVTTTSSGDLTSEGTICTSSGYKGDPTDCKKFYRCVDNGKGSYTKYEYICGEGTVWDPDIEACNHPWAVNKCGGTSTDINKIETTTAQSTVITVSLVQTTIHTQPENIDYDSGYGQNPSESPATTSTTKQPQSSQGSECTSIGFMGDKNDCMKFYRCVDNGNGGYTRYEFTCGEGTVWDSKIEACNHAWAVGKCGTDGTEDINKETTSSSRPTMSDEEVGTTSEQTSNPTQTSTTITQSTDNPKTTLKPSPGKGCSQEGFMGDKEDCKKFYRCIDNGKGGFTRYEFSCGEGTLWDQEITACNHPNSVKESCSSGSTNHGESISQIPETSTNEQEDQNTATQSTNEPQTTAKSSTSKPSFSKDCSQEGFMGDSTNCKKFYRCVDDGKGGYTKYEFTCGDGTIWDQEMHSCNHETSDSKCLRDSQTSKPQSESNDVSTSSNPTLEQQPTQKPQAPPTGSSNQCISAGFYANLEDCRKFYRCVDNDKGGYTKYDFTCGEGTMWVQEIQACDHDSDESCKSQNEFSSLTTEASKEQQTSTFSPPLEQTTAQQSDKVDDEYPNETSSEQNVSSSSTDCTAEGFYPNKKDCKKFYRCVENSQGGYTKYDFACGDGTAWDPDVQTCNYISEVKNCQNQGQEQSQPMHDEGVSESTGTSTLSSTQTLTSESVTEGSKPLNTDSCKQEGYYGNSKDCTKFYRCVDNGKSGLIKYDFTCGEGTIWDQDITACNHPQDVTNPSCENNDNSLSSTSTSSSTTTDVSNSSSESSSATESSSPDCSQGSTKKPDNKTVNCTKAGYYSDPNDCKKFYRCVDWDGDGKRYSVYHFECGEGTIWDPALDTCNHEDSVYPPRDCSGETQSQIETVDQESTTTESVSTSESPSTTTDASTTQESTAEQTTAQELTTSEQTTQQTTSEQITTEQTPSTEQTTTSKQTTTEQSTTHETATEPSTASEQTTTQQSTIAQTTEESTTTQKATTKEPTTSEQTTSEQITMEQTTTQQSTTQESTTQQSNTTEYTSTTENDQPSTSQQSTNTESATAEGTTEQSTTSQTDETETTESTTSTTIQDSSTTESEQESTSESDGDQTTENSSDNDCPETEDDQNLFVCPTSFKRHPKYCNMFYQCIEDDDTHDVQIATFHCPNNTIYDESKTQCVEEKKADKKCKGEIAQKRRLKRLDTTYKEPIVISNERLKCPAPGHYPFEKGECSPAFLKCQKTKSGKIRGYVYQCPKGYFYWSVSRRCEQKSHVRGCKKSSNNWSDRWEIPIERRNVAP